MTHILIAIAILCLAGSAMAGPPSAFAYATAANNTWILFKGPLLWPAAEVACRNLLPAPGGHLVHFPSDVDAAAYALLNSYLVNNTSPTGTRVCTWGGLANLIPAPDADNDSFAKDAGLNNLPDDKTWNFDASCGAICSNGNAPKLTRQDCDYLALSFVCKVKLPATNAAVVTALGSAALVSLVPFNTLFPDASKIITAYPKPPQPPKPPVYPPPPYPPSSGRRSLLQTNTLSGLLNSGNPSPSPNSNNQNGGGLLSILGNGSTITSDGLATLSGFLGGSADGCNWSKLNNADGLAAITALASSSSPPTADQLQKLTKAAGCSSAYNITKVLTGLGISLGPSPSNSGGGGLGNILSQLTSAQQQLYNALNQLGSLGDFSPTTCDIQVGIMRNLVNILNTTNTTDLAEINTLLSLTSSMATVTGIPNMSSASSFLSYILPNFIALRNICQLAKDLAGTFGTQASAKLGIESFLENVGKKVNDPLAFSCLNVVANVSVSGIFSGTVTTSPVKFTGVFNGTGSGNSAFKFTASFVGTSPSAAGSSTYQLQSALNGTVSSVAEFLNGTFLALFSGTATAVSGSSTYNVTGLQSGLVLNQTCLAPFMAAAASRPSPPPRSPSPPPGPAFDPSKGSSLGGSSSTSIVNILLGIFGSGKKISSSNIALLNNLLGGVKQGCNWTALNDDSSILSTIFTLLSSTSAPSASLVDSIGASVGCSSDYSLASMLGLVPFPPAPPRVVSPPFPPTPLSGFKYTGPVSGDDAKNGAGGGGGSDKGTRSFSSCVAYGQYTYCGAARPYSYTDAELVCEYFLGLNASLVTINSDLEYAFIQKTFNVSSDVPGYWTSAVSAGFGPIVNLRAFAPNDATWINNQSITVNSAWSAGNITGTFNNYCSSGGQCAVAYTLVNSGTLQFVDPGFALGVLCKVPTNQSGAYYSFSSSNVAKKLNRPTEREPDDIVIQVPLNLTFSLTVAACQAILADKSAFIIALANSTAEDWNRKNSDSLGSIVDGDVIIAAITSTCAAVSGRRSLLQSSTSLSTTVNVNTPPGTTADGASVAASSYAASGAVGLTGTAFASTYGISSIASVQPQAVSAVAANNVFSPPPPPLPANSPPPTTSIPIIPIAAGVAGGGVAIIIVVVVAVVMIKKKKKAHSSITPSP